MKLEYTCPDVYKEIGNGHFVISKTENPFSSIGINQTHEQNNAIIKGVGGVVWLLTQDENATLRQWKTAGPEVVR